MVGEACRQLSDIEDFTLQNVLIKAALVVKEGSTVEIMTSVRPSRLTDFLNSAWFDFTICSFNGAWITHCSGQLKAGGLQKSSVTIEPFYRVVSAPYAGMKSVGLNYGPYFRGLSNVSAQPGSNTASSTISAPSAIIQDSYQLHPTTMDCCLQLFMIATSEGISRRLDRLFVPTKIEELYVGQVSPNTDFLARATSIGSSNASITGNAVVSSRDGIVVMSLKGGLFSPVDSEEVETDTVAAAEIIWKPDIDLITANSLIRPRREEKMRESWLLVEELCLMCIIEMQYRLSACTSVLPHLEMFWSWLDGHVIATMHDGHIMGRVSAHGKLLTSSERCAQITALREQAVAGKASAVATLVMRVFDNCEALFEGKIQPLEILLPDDGLTRFYNILESLSDYSNFFSCLGHCSPGLRILEIGAGTGGTTSRVLKSLVAPDGTRLYSKYW